MAVSFLKRGAEARAQAKKVDAEQEQRQSDSKNRVRRFWLQRGTERRVTFLDGDLDENGELLMTTGYEHNLYMNGRWNNFFICTGNEDEPCPICEEGKVASYIAVFTVIDHTKFTDRTGKEHKDVVSLLVAKRQTQQLLEMQAAKRKGLTGCTFDVARTQEEQAAAVGTMFDYVGKNPLKAIRNKFGVEGPLEYEKVLNYKTADELRKMGFGKQDKIGTEAGVTDEDEDEFDDSVFGDLGDDEDEAFENKV